MPLSNSVIRRYTPPTCTLEVLAQSSPLSRWMGKSVLKQVRFNLSFDDPRQPEAEKIVVQGDRDQLEALYMAVSSYVQDILQQSPESFWASRVEAHSASKTSETTVEDVHNSQLDISNISNFRNEFASRGNIYLKPSSHLTHQLFLGSLASQVRGSSIQLSLLQLFDLATALDEYVADVVAMPTVTQRRRNSFAIPAWAPVAAVLLLGLGLMPLTYQYANRLREQKETGETVATANQEIGTDVSPTPLLTPLPTPNSLLTPLPNASPLPTLGSGLSVPNVPSSTSPNPTLGTTPGSTFPSISNPNSSSTIPLPPPGNSSLGGSTTTKPGIGESTLSLTPNSSSGKTQGTNSSTSSSTSISKGKTSLPSQTSTTLPPLINPTTPVIPILPSKQASAPQNNNQGTLNPAKLDRDLAAQLRESRTATPANNDPKSTTTAANSETLFDTNQVAEVRSYLKQRWQPPSGLKEPLQYSLTVGVDGALEQILPLGKAARDYVEKAGIPEIGQPFVSPSRNGQNVRVRAVFKPNGQVQAFPETD